MVQLGLQLAVVLLVLLLQGPQPLLQLLLGPLQSLQAAAQLCTLGTGTGTHTHKHTHMQRERERERDRHAHRGQTETSGLRCFKGHVGGIVIMMLWNAYVHVNECVRQDVSE